MTAAADGPRRSACTHTGPEQRYRHTYLQYRWLSTVVFQPSPQQHPSAVSLLLHWAAGSAAAISFYPAGLRSASNPPADRLHVGEVHAHQLPPVLRVQAAEGPAGPVPACSSDMREQSRPWHRPQHPSSCCKYASCPINNSHRHERGVA